MKREIIRRILALVGGIVLVLMYVMTLVTAVLDIPNWRRYFMASIGLTIVIPILLWINIYLYDRWSKRNTSLGGVTIDKRGNTSESDENNISDV